MLTFLVSSQRRYDFSIYYNNRILILSLKSVQQLPSTLFEAGRTFTWDQKRFQLTVVKATVA